MKWAQLYLWSSFGLFFLGDFVQKIDNLLQLTVFVSLALAALYVGYWLGVHTRLVRDSFVREPTRQARLAAKLIIGLGTVYFVVWAGNQIREFGGGGIGEIATNVMNPGVAYREKFSIYEERIATGYVNRVTQVLILGSVLQAAFVPLLVVYWREISRLLRVSAVIAVSLYIISFLYIGTQKGIGDVAIYLMVGVATVLGAQQHAMRPASKRKILAVAAVVLSFGFIYMAANQAGRALEYGVTESLMFGDVSESYLARLIGEPMAAGVYTLLAYPSHGYRGLSYNLSQEFVFSYGAGFSQAFESYRHQFLGGGENFSLTYPARTEAATGWPAGRFWSTAFPWFASDITFPGTILLMFGAGFVTARVWLRSVASRDWLAIVLLGQLAIFIAFLPANNQVLMQRQGLWTAISLMLVWLIRSVSHRLQ